jgi:hypothetical protein
MITTDSKSWLMMIDMGMGMGMGMGMATIQQECKE